MFRKLLISAVIATAVFAAGASVYAQSENGYYRYAENTAPVFELLNDIEEVKTTKKGFLLEARAKEGTEINMSVYWFKAENENSIMDKRKAKDAGSSGKDGVWLLQHSEDYTVGISGIFAEQVKFNLGRNRIVLYIKDKAGNTAEKTWEVERFLEEQVDEEINPKAINQLKVDMSNSISK
jgi:Tfp pilus assembly major pilin PilA